MGRVRQGWRVQIVQHALVGYAFAAVALVLAYALRRLLSPVAAAGAPFVLFFAAVTVTSLIAGAGPGVFVVLVGTPFSVRLFVDAGYALPPAIVEAALFAVDGLLVVYLTHSVVRGRRALEEANRRLQRANDELADAAARTRDVVELAPDAFFLADLEGRFTDVNEAACRMLGYERGELVGRTIFDLVSAADAARLERVKAELLTPGRVSRGEWVLRRKDGTAIAVEVSSRMLPQGRWQAFVRDITRRKELEDERQVFVSLLDNAPDFIGVADPDGKPIYVNPAGRRMVGLPEDLPLEETKIPDYYAPDVRAFASDVIVKSVIEQGRWSGETWFRHWQTGAAIPVSDAHFLIRDPSGGRVLGMGSITRDISSARHINDRLRESEERFRLAIDEAPIGMAIVGLDGRYLRVNRALCEIVGYTPAELMERSFQAITHPDDRGKDVEAAGQLARGELDRCHLGKRYVRKDGSVVDVMVHSSVVRDAAGAPLYFISQFEDITERKQADSLSRRLATIVQDANDAITLQDLDGNLLAWNRSAERMYGYSEAEALRMNVAALVPPGDRAALAYLDAGRRGQDAPPAEVKRRAKDGRLLEVALTTTLLREHGRPVAVATTEHDISERKQREQERQRDLDAMERLHRVSSLFLGERPAEAILYEILDAAIAISGADCGNIQRFDPATSKLEVVAHRNLPDWWLDYWMNVTKGHGTCGTALAGAERVVVEDVTRSPIFAGDALEVQLEAGIRAVQSTPLVSRSGEPIGMISTHWKAPHRLTDQILRLLDLLARQAADILERVHTEAALRLSEARSSGILAISADALISIDDQQRITMFNDGAEAIFGYSKAEMLGQRIERLMPERFRAHHHRHVEAFARGDVPARRMGEHGVKISGLRKNGEEFPADGTISKLEVDGTRILTVALRDITEHKQRELEIQRAVQARDQVLGVVAHDLRNPLAAIIMQAKTMQRAAAEAGGDATPAVVIGRAAARMNRLIQDLLDATRIESGRLAVERAPLAPAALVAEAVDLQRELAVSADLELQRDVPRELPAIWADRDRLLQVFENLIGNAIKFTAPGGRITVGAAPRDGEVLFWVKDTGRGIAAENLAHVFDRFWQAGGANAGRHGAGLGLPITKGIIEAHGGRIWVESAAGAGARFYFALPAGRPEGDRPSLLMH